MVSLTHCTQTPSRRLPGPGFTWERPGTTLHTMILSRSRPSKSNSMRAGCWSASVIASGLLTGKTFASDTRRYKLTPIRRATIPCHLGLEHQVRNGVHALGLLLHLHPHGPQIVCAHQPCCLHASTNISSSGVSHTPEVQLLAIVNSRNANEQVGRQTQGKGLLWLLHALAVAVDVRLRHSRARASLPDFVLSQQRCVHMCGRGQR